MKLKIKHPFLLTFILTIGIALLIVIFFRTEPCIRITGMVLQLCGVGSVIWGISETRELFGEPSIFGILKSKIKSIFKRTVHLGVAHLNSHGHASDNIRASQRRPFGVNQSLEERIKTLEKNFEFIDSDIKDIQEEMDKQKSEIYRRINEERERNQIDINSIHEKLKESATGGIHISALGASWLFFGVILSSVAPELSRLLN